MAGTYPDSPSGLLTKDVIMAIKHLGIGIQ